MSSPATRSVSRVAGNAALVAAVLLGLAACGGNPSSVDRAQFRPTTLLDAVLVGDVATVERLIARGADVNAGELDGTTPLMRAIHGGSPEIAKLLIDAGAVVSATNRYGVNPLYLAARGNDPVTTHELLAAGADANTALPEGETALMTAAKAGAVDIVRELLAGGARLATAARLAERANDGVLPSGYGAAAGSPAAAGNGADPNAKEGWYGQTALMWAAVEGHAEITRLLIAGGANVDEHSRLIDAPESSYERLRGDFVYPKIPQGRLTALHFAAREGSLAVVQALIDGDADLDAVDAEGMNALIYATINGHLDVTSALLEAGANPRIADSYGRTVLFAAVARGATAAPRSEAPDTGPPTPAIIAKLALAKGADPNAALADALPSATDADGGARPNSILNKGATPFFRAALSDDLELMNLLLDAGADPLVATDARDPIRVGSVERPASGRTTTLMAAAGVGWSESIARGREADAIEALRLLLDRGADVNAANQAGDTALHGATLRGSTTIVQFLFDHGADPTVRNASGQTPLDLAVGVPDERIPYNEATAALLRRLSRKD
jgi:ankyrin repeat protein